MNILRMTAVFGKLDGDTLECKTGLNLFTLPNEAGKTTWSAFLLAMLYGVSTKERTTETNFAVKEKYAPWSGKAMQGRIDLVWNGRNITVERESTPRIPMGKFRAYDTDTGAEISELTADNCGQVLLGITRAVYERSAFIGQNALAVTQDASLEQRLASLASTGDESVSYSAVAATLRQWKNHIRSNAANGKLVEAEHALAAVDAKLNEISDVHLGDLELLDARQRLQAELDELTKAQALLQLKEKAAAAESAKRMRQALNEAEAAAAESARRAEGIPAADVLEDLERRMDQLETEQKNFAALSAPQEHLPNAPDAPAPLRGLSAADAEAKGRADALILKKSAVSVPAIVLAVLGIVALVLRYFAVGAALLAVGAAWQTVLLLLRAKESKAVRDAYNAFDVEAAAAAYAQNLRSYEDAVAAEKARVAEETAKHGAQALALETEQTDILLAVRAFASNVYDLNDARNKVLDAKVLLRKRDDDALTLQNTRCNFAEAQADDPEEISLPPEAEDETRTLAEVLSTLSAVRQKLSQVEQTLAVDRGKVEKLGDPAALAAEKQQLEDRIKLLEDRQNALALAAQTLDEANEEISSRFSPQLGEEASRILAAMTDKRYEKLSIDRALHLTATERGAVISHALASFSGGTTDQIYFALRLAIAHLALPADAPLVLDDALVYFDDARLKAALDTLRAEAQTRQILLFTCQEREQKIATDWKG